MRRLFTAIVLSACCAAAAQAPARLTLKPLALVAGARVTLADVAGGAPADASTLAAIDLGAAPLPGYTARLSRSEIERALRARALPFALAPDATLAVRIERRAQAADPGQLVAAAQAQLQRQLASPGTRLELQALPLPDLALPHGAVEFRPRPLASGLQARRRMAVWVDVHVGGAFARAVAVPFEVRALRTVLAAARDLPAGAQPDCATLAAREEDIAALDTAPVDGGCEAVRGRLKRPLAQGTPLFKTHLQAELAVSLGDSVTLQMQAGAIVIESRATALEGGNVGQRIAVRPSGATQPVNAHIAGPALVKIY